MNGDRPSPHGGDGFRGGPPLTAELLQRVEDGFFLRSAVPFASEGAQTSLHWLDQTRPSVFGALTARFHQGASAPPYQGDERWVYVEAALTAPTLVDQRKLVSSVTHPQDAPFVATYCVGALFSDQVIDLEAAVLLDDADLSIICESLCLAGRTDGFTADLLACSDRFLQTPHESGANTAFEAIRAQLSRHRPGMGLELAAFQRRLQALKHRHAHVLGPDIFSSLQALAEADLQIGAQQLEAMARLMARWGLSDLFSELMLLRLLGPYEEERAFFRLRFESTFSTFLSPRQRSIVHGLLDGGVAETPARPRRGPMLDQLVQLMARIDCAFRHQDVGTLTDSVIDLYELDPGVIAFLPWDRIGRALWDAPRDARAAFLTLLMTEDVVRKRYPRVGLRLGKGALIADLQALIDIRRHDVIGSLLNQVKALPPLAATGLTRAILDRPIMERLASSLPTPRQLFADLRGLDRGRVSSMTLGALRAAGERDLIPQSEMRRLMDREVEDLRFHLLQNQLRTGRVKVAWGELERGLDDFFEQSLPITALRLSRTQTQSSTLAPRLAGYAAERTARFLILGSEYCVKQALSSNLRHGVMLPRFLRAFDDAVQTTWDTQSLMTWEPDKVRERMGEDGLLILTLREKVSELIKQHMAQWLDVDEDSQFEGRLKEALRVRILTHFMAPHAPRPSALRAALIAACRTEMRALLTGAARALSGATRRAFNQEIKALRRTLKSRPSPELRTYIDFLQANLHQAFEEVRQWMRLVNGRAEPLPFKLEQIVRLHLLDSALLARAPLKVSTSVEWDGRRADAAMIQGRYLGFFEEVVRNLLSNAFRGSGDELKTIADVQLIVRGRQMVLRCANAISPSRFPEVQAKYRNTVEQAQRRDARQARQDQRSGFQKIRLAYVQTLGCQPEINIPPPSPKARRFIVELRAELPRDDLFVAANVAA